MGVQEAIALGEISGATPVDEALDRAAIYGGFAIGDLATILAAETSYTWYAGNTVDEMVHSGLNPSCREFEPIR